MLFRSGVTMSRRLQKKAALMDWTRSADVLSHHVRAFAPEPGAFTFWKNRRLKILSAQPLDEDASIPEGEAGEVFAWKETPAVIAGEGALVLSRLQMAGKRPMNGDAFLRGRRNIVGDVLGRQKPGEA